MDVSEWLAGLGLKQYQQAFADHGIDADVLLQLTPEDLKEIGVTAVGHRRKLLEAIDRLRDGAASAAQGINGPSRVGTLIRTHVRTHVAERAVN